jgi:hypothetical protein
MIVLAFTRWHELHAKGRKSFIWQYGYSRVGISAGVGVAMPSLDAEYGLSWETLCSRLFVNEVLRKVIIYVPVLGTCMVE